MLALQAPSSLEGRSQLPEPTPFDWPPPRDPSPLLEPTGLQGADTTDAAEPSPPALRSMSYPRRADSKFYLEPVIFQVGNTLFKVDKKPFKVPGTIFEVMFSLPVPEGSDGLASVEGESDENPIHLQGIDERRFNAFLAVLLYPQENILNEEHQYRTYIDALELATLWEFKHLRTKLITMLTPLIEKRRYVEMIFVAKKHRVSAWLRTAYRMLIRNCSVLPVDELISSTFNLDWKTIAMIYVIRDAIVRQSLENTTCPQCGSGFGPNYGQKHEFKRYSCECRLNQFINIHFGDELDLLKEEPLDVDVFTRAAETISTPGAKKKKNLKKVGMKI